MAYLPASSDRWPPVAYEQRPWQSVDEGTTSRRARLATRVPYSAAVPPEVSNRGIPPIEPETLAIAEDAVLQLARFDSEVGGMVAPFAAILLRSESASSSEIERLTAGPRAIALAELGRSAGSNAKLIVSNARAMEAAITLADSIDSGAIIEMQRVLLQETDPKHSGRWRTEQVWVGGVGNSPHSAEFVPPHHERVPALIDDLCRFARRDDLPVLPQVALAHAQFETIHPFTDGNGRTGRALAHSMLRRLDVTQSVAVPVSAGLLQDTKRYFAALASYREGDVAPIIHTFADAALAAVWNGRKLVDDLENFREVWHRQVSARRGSAAYRMIDLLVRQHVVDANYVARELGVTAQNAQNAIDSLVADGVLIRASEGRRNRLFEASDITVYLDEFAQRARRGRR